MDSAGGRTVVCDHRSMTEGFLVRSAFRFVIATLTLLVFCSFLPLTFPFTLVANSRAATNPNAAPVQKLELTYGKAVVGAKVQVAADRLPAGQTVDLNWSTVTGGWVIQDDYYFRGRKYSETMVSLGKFMVSAGGHLDATFAIPEDYGGVHDVIASVDGRVVAQNGIE